MSDEIEHYGDEGISSKDKKVPRWLFWSYPVIIIWGFIWFYLYWNGANGWIDRGYWFELEKAANTTMPYKKM